MNRIMIHLAAFALLAAAAQGASAQKMVRGDFNKDGKVNVADVTATISYILHGGIDYPEPERDTVSVNGATFVMVRVEGGTFVRSATFGLNEVVTMPDYWAAQTEVTCELWTAVMGTDVPSGNHTPSHACDAMGWDDCQDFITRLNELTGRHFRVPSHDEWEYAAIGGNRSMMHTYAGSEDPFEVGRFNDNNSQGLTPVATKAPNELGLYDMSGNVSEYTDNVYFQDIDHGDGPASYAFCQLRGGGVDFASREVPISRILNINYERSKQPLNFVGLRLFHSAQ